MQKDPIVHVFVYGTLKRGQVRESMWPISPTQVMRAFARGALYDLGDYPAMQPGVGRVLGELWRFEPAHMEETLRILDEIEGHRGTEQDLYRRAIVTVEGDDRRYEAYTYFYNRSLPAERRISGEVCEWP